MNPLFAGQRSVLAKLALVWQEELTVVNSFAKASHPFGLGSASSKNISSPSSPSRSVELITTTYRGNWPFPSTPAPPTAPSNKFLAVLIALNSPQDDRQRVE